VALVNFLTFFGLAPRFEFSDRLNRRNGSLSRAVREALVSDAIVAGRLYLPSTELFALKIYLVPGG
jgi:hypothetical protein